MRAIVLLLALILLTTAQIDMGRDFVQEALPIAASAFSLRYLPTSVASDPQIINEQSIRVIQARNMPDDPTAMNIIKTNDQVKAASYYNWPFWVRRCRMCAYIYYSNTNYRLTHSTTHNLYWTRTIIPRNQLWALQEMPFNNWWTIENQGYYIHQTNNMWTWPNIFLSNTISWNSWKYYWRLQGQNTGTRELNYVKNLWYWNSYWRGMSAGLYGVNNIYDHTFRFVYYPCSDRYSF